MIKTNKDEVPLGTNFFISLKCQRKWWVDYLQNVRILAMLVNYYMTAAPSD